MTNFKDIKIFAGPMSKNLVDSVTNFCEKKNIRMGLIPSRRQIEYKGGYVNNWTTSEFTKYVRNKTNKVVLQRDHGGRLQGNLGTNDWSSFKTDVLSGFDLIHVDPWKMFVDLDEIVEETVKNIRNCSLVNPKCSYEIGTEEAIHKYSYEELDYFLAKTKEKLDPETWKSIKYAVIQAGTRIIGTKNVGFFDEKRCKNMINVCKKYNLLSKEHNGDYLTHEQIKKRFSIGLNAINIAPEFGVLETKTILRHLKKDDELFEKWFQLCYNSKRWIKWLPEGFSASSEVDKLKIVEVSGHYLFANEEFKQIKNKIKDIDKKICRVYNKYLTSLFKNGVKT